VPRSTLRRAGKDENHFFRKTFFTWSHRKVVVAITEGLADGGSIDSFVWDTLSVIHPELTQQTRIIAKSEEYGFPPIVVGTSISKQDSATMRGVLIDMRSDPDGQALLKRLNIDGFIAGDVKLYEKVVRLQTELSKP
jgi:phosphonate transport system substrate-binding protein